MKMRTYSELYHFGVKGMRWGIRRYQNKDGTLTKEGQERLANTMSSYKSSVRKDFTKAKGSMFDRIGGMNEKDEGSTFVSFKERDKYRYRDIIDALHVGEDEVAKLRLKSIKDIKVAGSEAQVKELLEYMGNYPITKDLGRGYTERARKIEKKKWDKLLKKSLKGDANAANDLFDNSFGLLVDRSSNMSIQMTKSLQQKGYDAVVDLWDAGFAECPLYVFDRKLALKTVNREILTQRDRDDAEEKVRNYD